MKRPGSFVFLLIGLISTLSFVVAAPIPVDFEVRNEVLERSPESFQGGRLVARAPVGKSSYAAVAAHAPAAPAPVAHAVTVHPAPAHSGSGHTTTAPAAAAPANPNERLNANRLKWGSIASAKLTAANHTPTQYNGANPHQAHMAMVHDYVNSNDFAQKYPQHANTKMDHVVITSPLHRTAEDPENHITVQLHTVGGNTHSIHVPGPNRKNSPTVHMGR